jgi:hypothetical protein
MTRLNTTTSTVAVAIGTAVAVEGVRVCHHPTTHSTVEQCRCLIHIEALLLQISHNLRLATFLLWLFLEVVYIWFGETSSSGVVFHIRGVSAL